MARTGTITGTIKVAEEGEQATMIEPVSANTGTVTMDVKGRLEVAASSTAALAFGGITTAQLLRVKSYDKTTGDPKSITLALNAAATITMAPSTEFIYVASENSNLTAAELTTAAGNTTVIEYQIAGQ